MARKKTEETVSVARPYAEAKADPEHIREVENRQPDQIADYHEKFPTLRAKKTAEPEKSESDE